MNKLFLLLFLSLHCFLAYGQEDMSAYRKGVIVFSSGDSITTEFSINLANDLVQLSEGGALKTFSARQIKCFYFPEKNQNFVRFFYTYYFNGGRGYGYPKLFEVLFTGTYLSLLTRETIVMETVPLYDGFSGRSILTTRQRVQTDYYLVTPSRNPELKPNVFQYRNSKKQIFKICKDKAKDMKAFYEEQNLSSSNKADLIKLVDYYNYLKAGTNNERKETPDTSK